MHAPEAVIVGRGLHRLRGQNPRLVLFLGVTLNVVKNHGGVPGAMAYTQKN